MELVIFVFVEILGETVFGVSVKVNAEIVMMLVSVKFTHVPDEQSVPDVRY